MNWLEFIASVIGSLAWPVVVLIFFFLFKKPVMSILSALAKRIPMLTKVNAPGGISAEFQAGVDAVKEDVEAIEEQVQTTVGKEITLEWSTHAPTTPQWEPYAIAEISPTAAVLASYKALEIAIRSAAERLGVRTDQKNGGVRNASMIAQDVAMAAGLERNPLTLSVGQLRRLRNEAAHRPDFEISVSSALGYVDTVESLIRVFDALGRRDNTTDDQP